MRRVSVEVDDPQFVRPLCAEDLPDVQVAVDIDDARALEAGNERDLPLDEFGVQRAQGSIAKILGSLTVPRLSLLLRCHGATLRGEREVHLGDEPSDHCYRTCCGVEVDLAPGEAANIIDRPLPAIPCASDVLDDRCNEPAFTGLVEAHQTPGPRRPRESCVGQRCEPSRSRLVIGGRVEQPLHDRALADDHELVRLIDVKAPLAGARLGEPSGDGDRIPCSAFAGRRKHAQQRLGGTISGECPPQHIAFGHARDAVRHSPAIADDDEPAFAADGIEGCARDEFDRQLHARCLLRPSGREKRRRIRAGKEEFDALAICCHVRAAYASATRSMTSAPTRRPSRERIASPLAAIRALSPASESSRSSASFICDSVNS